MEGRGRKGESKILPILESSVVLEKVERNFERERRRLGQNDSDVYTLLLLIVTKNGELIKWRRVL